MNRSIEKALNRADVAFQAWANWRIKYIDNAEIGYPHKSPIARIMEGQGMGDYIATAKIPMGAMTPSHISDVNLIVLNMPHELQSIIKYKYIRPGTETEGRLEWQKVYKSSKDDYYLTLKIAKAWLAAKI